MNEYLLCIQKWAISSGTFTVGKVYTIKEVVNNGSRNVYIIYDDINFRYFVGDNDPRFKLATPLELQLYKWKHKENNEKI